ncbi:IS701 family transposase [Streptomyces sp. NPDC001401]|uniref:IS701 family transposase n=1 Tax=Streptomyces sp. NPDC001401 TaxID=3364570 RepID=UPI0036A1D676
MTCSRPLADFVETVFGSLPRVDQRRWADVYLRGLLSTPGRKTMKRLARQVSCEPSAAQALQQFITSSPWGWSEPRAVLARIAARRLPECAWVTGTIVSEKRGHRSVGVHRRFVPELGATVNCQVGVGMFLSSEAEAIPVDWRLVLDTAWSGDASLRRQARIPDTVGSGSTWDQALEMAETADALQCLEGAPLVVDLTATGDPAHFTGSLARAGREFLVRVRPDQPVLEAARRMVPSRGVTSPSLISTAERLIEEGEAGQRQVSQAQFADGAGRVRLRSAMVHLPGVEDIAPGAGNPVHRLLALSAADGRTPPQYWISALRRRGVRDVLSLVRRQQVVQSTVRTLGDDFGLTDFEGRSFPGWHHHMTMVSAAYTYSLLSPRTAVRLSA